MIGSVDNLIPLNDDDDVHSLLHTDPPKRHCVLPDNSIQTQSLAEETLADANMPQLATPPFCKVSSITMYSQSPVAAAEPTAFIPPDALVATDAPVSPVLTYDCTPVALARRHPERSFLPRLQRKESRH